MTDSKRTECPDDECRYYDPFFDDNCGGQNMENCLMEKTDARAKLACSDGLFDLAQAWDKAAKEYLLSSENQPNFYMRGKREGAAYKLESCATDLREMARMMDNPPPESITKI